MKRLKFWRLERGLSQYDLAEASGLKRWKIQLLEDCHLAPTPDDIDRLSQALGVNPDALLMIQNSGGSSEFPR